LIDGERNDFLLFEDRSEEVTFRFELRSNTGRARPNQVSSSLIKTTAYIEEKVKRLAQALDYKTSDISSFTSGPTIKKLFF
jgi:hypothetical protein